MLFLQTLVEAAPRVQDVPASRVCGFGIAMLKWMAGAVGFAALTFESYWIAVSMQTPPLPNISGDNLNFLQWAVGQSGLFLALCVTLYLLFLLGRHAIRREQQAAEAMIARERQMVDAERARFDMVAKLLESTAGVIASGRDATHQLMTLVEDLRIQLASRDKEFRDALDRRRMQ